MKSIGLEVAEQGNSKILRNLFDLDLLQLFPPESGNWELSVTNEILQDLVNNNGEKLSIIARKLRTPKQLLVVRSFEVFEDSEPAPCWSVIVPYWNLDVTSATYFTDIGSAILVLMYVLRDQRFEWPTFFVNDPSQVSFLLLNQRLKNKLPNESETQAVEFGIGSPLTFVARTNHDRFNIQMFGTAGHWDCGPAATVFRNMPIDFDLHE